jgi:hypothetical protein
MFVDSPMKSWESKLKSPYTPDVGGAKSRIVSLVKLLQRPSGSQDKLQRTASLSILAVDFKTEERLGTAEIFALSGEGPLG